MGSKAWVNIHQLLVCQNAVFYALHYIIAKSEIFDYADTQIDLVASEEGHMNTVPCATAEVLSTRRHQLVGDEEFAVMATKRHIAQRLIL